MTMNNCYIEGCSGKIVGIIFIDGSLTCEEHAPGDYTEELEQQ